MPKPQVLICTVGTGNVDDLRASLLIPLTKSVKNGDWKRVVLLPSQTTIGNAATLQAEIGDSPIEIRELPKPGVEDNADDCFAHFDQVIAELRREFEPEQILADFTRGTKAMSAALVLAAVRHGLPQLRYLSGAKRDARGMVVPGTEVIKDIRTTEATARRRLDDALNFLRHGQFAAVLELLPDPTGPFAGAWPTELIKQAALIRPLATYFAAWDRLDYKAADAVVLPDARSLPAVWEEFVPTAEVRNWVHDLAADLPDDAKDRAGHLRRLAVDLLANGERRLRDRHFEDSIIRAYRVLELIGQFRLCDRGIHSDDVPENDPTVQAFQAEMLKNRSATLMKDYRGKLLASREQVARLLKRFGDTLAQRLLDLGSIGSMKAKVRNNSVLIHGFEASGGSDAAPLEELYSKLEQVLQDDSPDSADRLKFARFIKLYS